MIKFKSKLVGFIAAIALLCGILGLISACTNTSETYTVTFMVQNETGEWKQVGNSVEVTDGAVTLPNDPVKSYYVFLGWYTTSTFEAGTEFKNENISSNLTVYASFSAKEAEVYINGESMGKQTLVDVINGDYNPGEGLEFDGWYTDSNYTVKYENTDDTSAIYARSVARITYDNGYETVYETTVLPYVAMSQPSLDDIVKFYMDSEDIFFTVDGEDYDWSQPVTKSMTIDVEWKTPNMVYAENANSGNLTCTLYGNNGSYTVQQKNPDLATYPCIRIPSRVTYNDELRYVDACANTYELNDYAWAAAAKSVKTVIFAEGIKMIRNFEGVYVQPAASTSTPATVEEVVLPSTLKIIETSFNFFPSLKSVELPEGLEIIIDSFWSDYIISADNYNSFKRNRIGYDFDIAVPDTVINLSQVPTNLTFGENSCFYKDSSDRIYKNDERGKVLIADYNIDESGTLTVEEGVVGIQVGTFFCMPLLKYLSLPSTWQFVSYNEDVTNYDYYYYNGDYQYCTLYNSEYADNFLGSFSLASYVIFDNVSGNYLMTDNVFQSVFINQPSMPETIYEGSLTGRATYSTRYNSVTAYTHANNAGKVAFVGSVDECEDIVVLVNANNSQGAISKKTVSDTVKSGTVVTLDNVLNLAGLNGNLNILSVTQFGEEFMFDKAYDHNLYLDITYELGAGGYTYETNESGTVTITGFDQNTAHMLSTGFFLVNIPDDIDGVAVTEIAANAFEGEEAVSFVFIPSSVKKIGESAFKNCSNLSSVNITAGGLEYIGESAFEGCIFTTIALPLEHLTYVGPYAFKSQKLTAFTVAAGETAVTDVTKYEAGKYYIRAKYLIRYVSTSVEQQYNYDRTETEDVTVYDVQLIALPGKITVWSMYGMGYSVRATGTTDYVVRFEIMTGSVSYLNGSQAIIFGVVSKIHTNAFTDMHANYLTYTSTTSQDENGNAIVTNRSKMGWYYGESEEKDVYENWVTQEQINNMDSEIFEEGWWEGWTEEDEEYAQLQLVMEYAYRTLSCTLV